MKLATVLSFLSTFFIAFAWLYIATSTRRRVAMRVVAFTSSMGSQQSGSNQVRRRQAKNGLQKQLQLLFDGLQNALIRAEIDVSAYDFFVRWAFITLFCAIIGFLAKGPDIAVIFVVLSIFSTFLFVRMRGNRRLHRFEESLNDMLTITANSLRAGYSFIQAVQVVSEDMHGPIQEELHRTLAEINVGVPLEEAFKATAARISSQDFNLIVTAILIQRQVGGNLAEVLDRIAETIRERVQLKREVKSLTTQGRMSAMIFMFLPVGVGVMIYMMDSSYIGLLFQTMIGRIMLGVALLMQIFGFLVIRKMVEINL